MMITDSFCSISICVKSDKRVATGDSCADNLVTLFDCEQRSKKDRHLEIAIRDNTSVESRAVVKV